MTNTPTTIKVRQNARGLWRISDKGSWLTIARAQSRISAVRTNANLETMVFVLEVDGEETRRCVSFWGGWSFEDDYLSTHADVVDSGTNMSDRGLVVATLHYSGELRHTVTEKTANTARRLSDGFGSGLFMSSPRTWDENTRCMFADWSSIRDSSDGAFANMAAIIRQNQI